MDFRCVLCNDVGELKLDLHDCETVHCESCGDSFGPDEILKAIEHDQRLLRVIRVAKSTAEQVV